MQTTFSTSNPIRLGVFAVFAASLIGLSALILLRPSSEDGQQTATDSQTYPQQVTLPDWQLTNSEAVEPYHELMAPGQIYQFEQSGLPLTAQTHLQVNSAGAVNQFLMLMEVNLSPENLIFKSDPERGSYGVVLGQDKTYIASCVNASGKSTFTQGELASNRYQYGLSPSRTVGWLLGWNELTDNRCLFTVMSLPVTEPTLVNHEKNIPLLENAWDSWYDWWKKELQKPEFQ